MILSGLQPETVLSYFEKLTTIPHGSGNCEAIGNYIYEECIRLGAKARKDEYHNVVAFVDATPGHESAPVTMLQGHMDMVAQKTAESTRDFQKDPLELVLDGDFLRANGTTLGGDDGLAVAMMLAVLKDRVPHPALELLFTSDEEIGMVGAFHLDLSDCKAQYVINLDNEDEGSFIVSCAGGARYNGELRFETVENTGKTYALTVKTTHGGHSGTEIHKNRASAVKVLVKALKEMKEKDASLRIIRMDGGTADNAIPMQATAYFTLENAPDYAETDAEIASVYGESDPVSFTLSEHPECTENALSETDSDALISFVFGLKNGVIKMSEDFPGLVETSLNFGILKTEKMGTETVVKLGALVRSSTEPGMDRILADLTEHTEKYPMASYVIRNRYPGWAYRKESTLRDKAVALWKERYETLSPRETQVVAIHAGLECGVLYDKLQDPDIISLGATALYIHTPSEKISISSLNRVYGFLKDLLNEI